MKDTAERQLRAYTFVGEVKIVNETGESRIIAERWIHVKMENFGQVPATTIRCIFAVCVKEWPLRSTLDGTTASQTNGVIAPHDTFTAHIPLDNSVRVLDPRDALYIHGEIHYFDGFEKRVTPLRFMRKGGPNWFINGDMETCQEGNDPTQPPYTSP